MMSNYIGHSNFRNKNTRLFSTEFRPELQNIIITKIIVPEVSDIFTLWTTGGWDRIPYDYYSLIHNKRRINETYYIEFEFLVLETPSYFYKSSR